MATFPHSTLHSTPNIFETSQFKKYQFSINITCKSRLKVFSSVALRYFPVETPIMYAQQFEQINF